jgi:23S rRNA (guanosine2251-2'-O)-methyltransferase
MEKNSYWIGGRHAVEAALLNPARKKYEIVLSDRSHHADEIIEKFKSFAKITTIKNQKFFNKIFPLDFKHQGVAARISSFDRIELKDYLKNNADEKNIVLLDGVTDPRNIGSIIRNCIAFNVSTIILHEQGLNAKSPSMHVAASGAIEHINLIIVKNISSALRLLKENDFWVFGFDGTSKLIFDKSLSNKKNILIFGDEGSGLRDLTKKLCDQLVKIPISRKIESLNVSSAVVAALSFLR